MAGLVGIGNYRKTTQDRFNKAVESMLLSEITLSDEFYTDDKIMSARTHLNIFNKYSKQPFVYKDYLLWFDGELYGADNVLDDCTANLIVCKSFENKKLENLNGIFAAVIYDMTNRKLHLITDRLGLRRLFYYHKNGVIAWGSDLKVFKNFEDCDLSIRTDSVRDFLNLGHLIDDNSWFNEVRLVLPASVLTFDLNNATLVKNNYWNWDRIMVNTEIDSESAIKEASSLFKKAVAIRSDKNSFISLSGGLDSRAIIAFSELHQTTYTYGNENSSDVIIAEKVAEINESDHHFYPITTENWMKGRIEGVWKNDGLSSFLHMHFAPFHDRLRILGKINLNGFLGDVVFGGSYLSHNLFDSGVNLKMARAKFGDGVSEEFLNNEYFGNRSSDPYFIFNRGIRFIMMGTVESSRFMEHRKPFLDNHLLEFLYSIPAKERYLSKFYNQFLLTEMPEYFKNIPWQRTARVISPNKYITAFQLGYKQFIKVTSKILRQEKYDFSNHHTFIQSDQFRKLYDKLINRDAIYIDYYKQDLSNLLQETVSNPLIPINKLGNLITMELWFQQFFHEKYKTYEP